jgi:hypothetical protein
MRRPVVATFIGIVTSLLIASSAMATDCTNASKSDPAAGAQALIDATTGEILWTTPGLAERLELGVIGPDGEGFHGLVAFDVNGDGIADFSTWVGVGPDGDEIPQVAQLSGPACRGLTNLFLYFTVCQGS